MTAVQPAGNSRDNRRSSVQYLRRAVVALACATLAAGVLAADLPTTFDPARDASRDLANALALAKAQDKRVIVDVGGEWCTWCHILDRFIAANPEVRARIEAHYVWLKINFSPQNANEAVLSRWPRVAGYPHLFVLDASGALVHSQDTGALEDGRSYDKGRFLAFLDRAARPSLRAAVAAGLLGLVGRPTHVF